MATVRTAAGWMLSAEVHEDRVWGDNPDTGSVGTFVTYRTVECRVESPRGTARRAPATLATRDNDLRMLRLHGFLCRHPAADEQVVLALLDRWGFR